MKNRTFATLAALITITAIGLPVAAHGVEFNTVLAERSRIEFTFKQMNVGMHGRFKKFAAQLIFDPSRPTSTTVSLDVDLASIDTGSSEGDSEVAGKQWFNTRAYPNAHFASTRIRPLAGDRYDVTGQLAIKGRTQIVSVPTTVSIQGNSAAFDGSFVVRRADFAIGEGPWADFSVVANEILVSFHLVATSGP